MSEANYKLIKDIPIITHIYSNYIMNIPKKVFISS